MATESYAGSRAKTLSSVAYDVGQTMGRFQTDEQVHVIGSAADGMGMSAQSGNRARQDIHGAAIVMTGRLTARDFWCRTRGDSAS